MKRRVNRATDANDPRMEALLKFRLIVNSSRRHFRWIETQCGVNGVQLWALWEIGNANELTVTGLAHALAIHQSSASNLVEKLVSARLVLRRKLAVDKRVVTLELAARGTKLLARAPKPARGLLPEALHRLPPAAIATLNNGLGALLDAMGVTDAEDVAMPLGLALSGRIAQQRSRLGRG